VNTKILSYVDHTLTLEKTILGACKFRKKKKILPSQTRLLHNALEPNNLRQHYELFLVQNPILKDDEEYQPTQKPLSKPAPDSSVQIKINFLFPNGSLDLGKKTEITST
jgi:hypothetical protein